MNNNLNMLNSILNIINMPIDNDITNVLQRSFTENKPTNKPTEDKFIKNLKEVVFDDNKDEISCGICLETFKKGEKAICLPCKDKSHYFHIGDKTEECGGILPWLKENNTCPICREEFPEENIELEDNDMNENIEMSNFLESINEFDENTNDDINNEVNTEEISNILANTFILTTLMRPPPRRQRRNIILSETNIDELEELQIQEALERSMSEI